MTSQGAHVPAYRPLVIVAGTRADRGPLFAADRSIAQHARHCDRAVLVADALPGEEPITGSPQICGVDLLGAAKCARRAHSSSPEQFVAWLVPHAIRHFAERGYRTIVGLPPGAFVVGSLDPLLRILLRHDVEPDPAFETGWWGWRAENGGCAVRHHPADDEIVPLGRASDGVAVVAVAPDDAAVLPDRYRREARADFAWAYRRALRDAGGGPSAPYRYGRFSNGIACDPITRALLREALASGEVFGDPGDVRADPSFFAWLAAPSDGKRGLSRYLARYVELNPALRRTLRAGAKRADTVVAHLGATRPDDLDPFWYRNVAGEDAPGAIDGALGVNLVGLFRAELGIGESGRSFARALRLAGEPVALLDFSSAAAGHRRGDATIRDFGSSAPHHVSLLCANPPELGVFDVHPSRAAFESGRYRIAAWWWELPEVPATWQRALDRVDEVWVGSTFVKDALSRVAAIPIVRIPPIVEARPTGPVYREAYGVLPGETAFLLMFDYLSVWERKNPDAVIDAFRTAFRRDERVRLVIKTINSGGAPDAALRLEELVADDPRISILDAYFDRDGVSRLIRACDAYVSLHRSEGFGLTIAEAMAYGKPVVATNWSGNVDFTTQSNSYLVDAELVKLAHDYGPYPRGSTWAEPDVEHAAYNMRAIVSNPHEASRRASRARLDIRTAYCAPRVAALARERLDTIRRTMARRVA